VIDLRKAYLMRTNRHSLLVLLCFCSRHDFTLEICSIRIENIAQPEAYLKPRYISRFYLIQCKNKGHAMYIVYELWQFAINIRLPQYSCHFKCLWLEYLQNLYHHIYHGIDVDVFMGLFTASLRSLATPTGTNFLKESLYLFIQPDRA
jgi:hypothetical protein